MKRSSAGAALALLLFGASAMPTAAAPCTTATDGCTEWITLAGGPSRSLVYRTFPLTARNEAITRVFVLVHGAGRDANNYFRTAVAAAFLAGALEDTLVVAPRFASNDADCRDALAPNEVSWPCNGNSWRAGGTAVAGNQMLTSFDFADEILRRLADTRTFPNLKALVVAGHSAGGQFVTRYEMANRVHDTLGMPITYVVANPSSYAYLDAQRPNALAYASTASAPGYIPAPPAEPRAAGSVPNANSGAFRPFGDDRNCTTFNQWPYGLQKRAGYTEKLSDDQLKKQLAARPTTYLLGELDILPLGGFDASCPAMAQGPTRLARGQAFSKYVNEKFGAQHRTVVVPLCGHNARCMFTSDTALTLVFPKS
jgi:pimeloyl-ACP methyl ester carboxylesterase